LAIPAVFITLLGLNKTKFEADAGTKAVISVIRFDFVNKTEQKEDGVFTVFFFVLPKKIRIGGELPIYRYF
jgi:hypothetical protein